MNTTVSEQITQRFGGKPILNIKHLRIKKAKWTE